jgi:hypothetical protein
MTKRGLYKTFCLERGHVVKFDCIGRMNDYKKNPIYATRFDASSAKEIPSWKTFLEFWKENYKDLVMQRATEDICGDCFIFANRSKHLAERCKTLSEQDQEDDSAIREAMLESEALIEKAAEHVKAAKLQRELFNAKKKAARQDLEENKPHPERVHTFVCNYSQNLCLPSFAAEQPGETYYYSPMNVYCFGMVEAASDELTAMCYLEEEGKKGSNNVASMLWEHLVNAEATWVWKGWSKRSTCL